MIAFLFLPFYIDFVRTLVDGFKDAIGHEPNRALYLAWAHTTFNILNCIIFLPFIGLVEKICVKLIPQKEDTMDNKTRAFASPISDSNPLPMLKLKAIEKSIINPSADFYVDPAKKAIRRMLNYTKESLSISQYLADKYEESMFHKAEQIEDVIDYCQILLNNYIDKAIIAHEKTSKKNTEIGLLHHAVNDIEQIGDISYSLAKRMKASFEFNMNISDEEKQQILSMFLKVMEMMDDVLEVINNGNTIQNKIVARKAYELEYSINAQLRDFRNQLRQRPVTEGYGWCIANISDVYSDLENVGDKLKNVLEAFGYPQKTDDDELN